MDCSQKKYSILLVEDNKLNQMVVKFSLKQYNFSLDIANSGFEALEMFKEGKYDFILMDIMMPEMDGFETSRKIRELETSERTSIFALTADILTTNEQKCKDVDMDGYISKPFEAKNLFSLLDQNGL